MLYDWFARATAAIAGNSNESAAKETDVSLASVANASHAPTGTVSPVLTTSGTLSQREQDVSTPSLLNSELNAAATTAQDSAALPRLQKKAKKKKRDVGETGAKTSSNDKVEAASKKNKKLKSKIKPDRQAPKKKIRHQQHFEMGQDNTEVNRVRLDDERDQITQRNAETPSVPNTLTEQAPVFSAPTNKKLARNVENVSGRCNNVDRSDKLVSNDAEISGAMRHIGRLTTLETFSPLISSRTTIPHDSSPLLVEGIKNTGDKNEVVLVNKKRVTPTIVAAVSSAASTQQSSSSTSTSSRGLRAGTEETLFLHDSLRPRNKRVEELPRIPLPPPGFEGKLPPLPPNLKFLPPPPFLADLPTSDQRSKLLKRESTKMPVLLELRDSDDAKLESKLSDKDGSRLLPLETQKLPLEQQDSLSRSSSQISPSLSSSSSQSAEMTRGPIRAPPPKLLRPVAELNEAAQRAAVLPPKAASVPKRKMVTPPKRVAVKQPNEELSVVVKPKVTKTFVKTAFKPTPPVKPQPGAALTPSANLGLLDVKQDKQFFRRFFERQATLTTRLQQTRSIPKTSEATEKKKSAKTKGKRTLLKKDKKGDHKLKSKNESNWVETIFGPRYVVNSLPCGLTLPVQFEGAGTWNATRQIALQQELEDQQHRLSQAKSRLHYLHTHLYERWDIGLQSAELQRGKCCAALLNLTLDYRDRSLAQAFYHWKLQIYLCQASVKTHRRVALRTFAAVTQRHLQHHFFHLRTYCAADEEASSSTSSALPFSWSAVVRFSWPPLEHELLVRSLMHYDDVLTSFEALLNEIKHRTVCFGFSAMKSLDKRKP